MTSQPISLIRGQSHTATIRIELGGASLDLATASAATFTARPSEYSPVAKITKALGAGVTAGVAGLATVALTTGDTSELDISNSYSWMLTATVSDVEHIVARGVLTAIGAPQQFPDEGGTSGPVTASSITDAGTAGKAVLTAETAAQGRTALVVPTNYISRRITTGNVVLTASEGEHQRFVLDADRGITLPAEGTTQWRFLLVNTGESYNATVKRAGGATVGIIIAGGSMLVAWDGTGFGAA